MVEDKMNEDLIVVIMIVFSSIISFLMGGSFMESQWQKRAVKVGVAEWVAGAYGNAEFKFKTK